MRRWAVNMRLEMRGYPMPKEAMRWVFTTHATMGEKLGKGVYSFLSDGSLVFLGGYEYTPFQNCYGWFPARFPYDDPYQPIFEGMTASEFAHLLRKMGFREV